MKTKIIILLLILVSSCSPHFHSQKYQKRLHNVSEYTGGKRKKTNRIRVIFDAGKEKKKDHNGLIVKD